MDRSNGTGGWCERTEGMSAKHVNKEKRRWGIKDAGMKGYGDEWGETESVV